MAKIYAINEEHNYDQDGIDFINGVGIIDSEKTDLIAEYTAKGYTATGIGTKQVETATVVGTVSTAGNASVVVTAAGMTGSPKTLSVAVALNDTASQVAEKIRAALEADSAVTALFAVGGSDANIILTQLLAAGNDNALNIAIDNDTCAGLTTAASSANTTAGVAAQNELLFWDKLTKAQCLEFAISISIDGASEMTKKELVDAIVAKIDTIP